MKPIFNADDYGMSAAIDEGILIEIRNEIVNSVSVSVLEPRIFEVYRHLNSFKSKIAVGLHVNLTEGKPLILKDGDSLVDRGFFCAAHKSLENERLHEVSVIEAEIAAQLERFRKIFGVNPSHLDSHQHFTFLSVKAHQAFVNIASANEISIRSPAPFLDRERLKAFVDSVESRFGVLLSLDIARHIGALKAIQEEGCPRWRTVDCRIDHDEDLKAMALLFQNEVLKESVEIVCHPLKRPLPFPPQGGENLALG